MRRRIGIRTALVALVALTGTWSAPPAMADLTHGSPDNPGFNGCESQSPITGCTDNEQWDLFGPLHGSTCPDPVTGQPVLPHPDGGLPCWALAATDPQHASGMNFTGAWQQGNTGRDDVLIAYIEGGVNYASDSIKGGLDSVFLNRGELPYPEYANGTVKTSGDPYDLNGDGRLDIRDYAQDPRVNPPCASGVQAFAKHQEGVTWSCVPGGQHQYLHALHVAGVLTPYLSPEDLIAVFGDCQISAGLIVQCVAGGHFDNDRNGYANDISGWNFDRNTNDPQTEDFNYSHAPGNITALGGEPDNSFGTVGECASCRVVPIKQGAECLGRSDRWGESILYATDLGATAISSVVVEYTYSSFSQAAVDYAYDHGVLLSLDSNDFDSMDHTDGMFFNHVFPGNSLAEDKGGLDNVAGPWGVDPTTSFRARSNITSYGTHNLFSTGEYYTSGATPMMAAVLAMTQSAAYNARDRGVIPDRLTPNEIKQVLIDTSSAVIPQTQEPGTVQQWPGNPLSFTDTTHTNWSTQYGYGRPDIGAATSMIMSGQIPPTADITSPRWYQYVDPTVTPSLEVDGSLAPSRFRSGGWARYVLEFALGADPADSAFSTVASGQVSGALNGVLGDVDLSKVPAAFYDHAPGVTLQPDGAEQYTATIRLRVWDANGLKAEDRRSIGLRHDPSLVGGEPTYLGAEAGAAPTFADLEGRGYQDLVVVTNDGDVHAFRPDGSEAPGFPVHSNTDASLDSNNPQNYAAAAYRVAALHNVRDPLTGLAVGDLFHDGRQEIVASSTNGDVYAWDGHGRALSGFPLASDSAYWSLPVPTPWSGTNHGRLPSRGAWAPPVLADLEGTGQLDILQSEYDGFLYAWRPDGSVVPGWPVQVRLPAADFTRDGVDPSRYIRDAKLMYPPSVANVLKDPSGRPQVFVPSFESNGVSSSTENLGLALLGANPDSTQDLAKTWLYGIWADGNNHAGGAYLPNWPVAVPSASFTYDQSIDFVGESTSPPAIGDVDGSGTLRLVTSAITGAVYVYNGDGSVYGRLTTACDSVSCGSLPPYRSTGDTNTITLTGSGVLGDLLNTGTPQFIQNSAGLATTEAALSVPGLAGVPQVYERAWNIATGQSLPGFPQRVDGFPFFSSSVVADLTGLGYRSAAEGNDDYWVHAFGPGGVEAPGFPKYTGQWLSFAGAVGDPKYDGQLHYVIATREGWLYNWAVQGSDALNDSWWHYRHDEHNSGLYGYDPRPPARPGNAAVHGNLLTWDAPGGHGMVGRAAGYQIRWSYAPITAQNFDSAIVVANVPAPGSAGSPQSMTLAVPAGAYVAIRAVGIGDGLSPLAEVITGSPASGTRLRLSS